nr:hypothetical protein [Mycolicibacterium malmesburyense]
MGEVVVIAAQIAELAGLGVETGPGEVVVISDLVGSPTSPIRTVTRSLS